MTEIILDDCTIFGKIVDVYKGCSQGGLVEFLKNVVMNMDMHDEKNNCGYGVMLKDFSNIYVLVSKRNFPFHKLTKKNNMYINLKKAKRNFVLGYIWLCPWEKTNYCNISHYINFIDTRISGLNIADYMIHLYETKYEDDKRIKENNNEWICNLLPYEIPNNSAKYWKRHFANNLCVENLNDIVTLTKLHDIKQNDIKWEELYSLYDTETETETESITISDTDSDKTALIDHFV
jgi:hypothetical protein